MKKPSIRKYGMGGQVPVEVEGNEVAQTPQGEIMQFEGPSHEKGGIPTTLPTGTIIFSDRVKIGDKTLQERKLDREKRMKRVSKFLENNPTDAIGRKSADRVSQLNQIEEQSDLAYQEAVANAKQAPMQKAAYGSSGLGYSGFDNNGYYDPYNFGYNVPDLSMGKGQQIPVEGGASPSPSAVGQIGVDPVTQSPKPQSNDLSQNPNMGAGNVVGAVGTIASAVLPLLNTQANQRATRPNINHFMNFGQKALQANDAAQANLAMTRESAVRQARTARNSTVAGINNTTGNLATANALKIGADMNLQEGINNGYDGYLSHLNALLGERGQLENTRDNVVMTGAAHADELNRRDVDAYYTNMGQNLSNLGSGVQQFGKTLNQQKYNTDSLYALNNTSKYGVGFEYDRNGNIVMTKVH